jgi:hypothetical protein
MKEVKMLEPMHIFDEIATTKILADEMHSLYLFSFLLTADNDIAEHCYVRGLGECVEGISVFMDWARSGNIRKEQPFCGDCRTQCL